jgi:hypothetical protein
MLSLEYDFIQSPGGSGILTLFSQIFPHYAGQAAPLLKHRRAIEVIHEVARGLG